MQDSGGLTAPSIDTRASSFGPDTAVVTIWTYGKEKFDPSLGIGELRVRINVDPQRGTDDMIGASAVEKAIAKVAEKSIVNPSGATTGVAAVAPAVPAAATGAAPAPAAPPPPAAAPAPATAPSSPAAAAGRTAAAGTAPPPASAPATTLPAEVRSSLERLTPSSKAEDAFKLFEAAVGQPEASPSTRSSSTFRTRRPRRPSSSEAWSGTNRTSRSGRTGRTPR